MKRRRRQGEDWSLLDCASDHSTSWIARTLRSSRADHSKRSRDGCICSRVSNWMRQAIRLRVFDRGPSLAMLPAACMLVLSKSRQDWQGATRLRLFLSSTRARTLVTQPGSISCRQESSWRAAPRSFSTSMSAPDSAWSWGDGPANATWKAHQGNEWKTLDPELADKPYASLVPVST